MEYYKKDCKNGHKKMKKNDDHEYCYVKEEKYEEKYEDHFNKTVVDFDFSNQAGSVALTTNATTGLSTEEIIGELDFNDLCNGDFAFLTGSSTVTTLAGSGAGTVTFRIRKVKKFQDNPLLGQPIYTRSVSVLAVVAAGPSVINAVPIDFVDVLNNEENVSYYLTVSATATAAATPTLVNISNTTFAGTIYR